MLDLVIGQERLKRRLETWIRLGEIPNVLLRGRPGSGKTFMAKILAQEVSGGYWLYVPCRKGKVVSPPDPCIIILDEIHNLANEEEWYNWSGRIVGCTTEGAPMSEAFQSRFIEEYLDPYSITELVWIISRNSSISPLSCLVVALRSRGCPRTAVLLGKEVERAVKCGLEDTKESVEKFLDEIGVFAGGYTKNDLAYLDYLRKVGHAGLSTIARSLRLPIKTVEQEIEPFLLSEGRIRITSRGREIN